MPLLKIENNRWFKVAEVLFAIVGFIFATITLYEFFVRERSYPSISAYFEMCPEALAAKEFEKSAIGLGNFLLPNSGDVVFLDLKLGAYCTLDVDPESVKLVTDETEELWRYPADIHHVLVEYKHVLRENLGSGEYYSTLIGENMQGEGIMQVEYFDDSGQPAFIDQNRFYARGYDLRIREGRFSDTAMSQFSVVTDVQTWQLKGLFLVQHSFDEDKARVELFPVSFDSDAYDRAQCAEAMLNAQATREISRIQLATTYFKECILP